LCVTHKKQTTVSKWLQIQSKNHSIYSVYQFTLETNGNGATAK